MIGGGKNGMAMMLAILDTLFLAIIVAGTVGAIAVTGGIIVTILAALTEAINALAILGTALWYAKIEQTLFGIVMASLWVCSQYGPPTSPLPDPTDPMTFYCTYILTFVALIKGLK